MANVSLSLLVLKTRQVERLRQFYHALGIDFNEEQHGKGPVHFAGRVDGLVLEIYPLADDGFVADPSTRLGFAAENLAAAIDRLKKVGFELVTSPRQTAWGLQAVVRDPDGRAVELTER